MADWLQFENESTEDLIQYIKWKEQPEYKEASELAFVTFTFRFRTDVIKKCEIICNRRKYDLDVAKELANRVFKKFWDNPNYKDDERRNAKSFDEGVKFYLFGIANYELVNLYRQQIDPSPYTGDEKIIWDFPEIDVDSMSIEKKKELIERREIIEIALGRLSPKHRAIYLTYLIHGRARKNLPSHLLKQLRDDLEIAQGTIRYYKFEADKTINDYLKIWDKVKK